MQLEPYGTKQWGHHDVVVENIDYSNPYDFNKLHRHAYFEFILFEKGLGGKQIIDFQEYEISSRTLYLILPGQVHLMKRLPDENGILIQFGTSALAQSVAPLKIDHRFQLSSSTAIELSTSEFETVYGLFKRLQEVYHSNTLLRAHKLTHLLGCVLLEILETVKQNNRLSSPNNCAYQFLKAAEMHFKTIKTVRGYAELLNIPINKLSQKVKTHFGKSPLQIIHEILLVEIKRLMLVEQLSHKEISYQLNFDSQSSYSRFIKKHTLLSPSDLKEQLIQIAH